MTKIHTLVDQPLHCMPHAVMLLSPPASEEGNFHVDKALVLVGEELLNDRVQDVLNARILYVVFVWNVNSNIYRQYCVKLNTTLHVLGCHHFLFAQMIGITYYFIYLTKVNVLET